MTTLSLQHIPNVQIGILSEIQDIQDKATISNQPLPNTFLEFVENITKKLGLNFLRTPYCKHRGSCICSGFASSTKAALLSYLIKAGITTVFSIKKIIKDPKKIIDGFKNKDSLKFGLFICVFLVIFRLFVCGLRRKLSPQKHKYAYLLGGLIGASLSSLILDKKSRQSFGLFLIARAFDIAYKSLVEKKIIPDFKYFYPFLYATMMIVTGGIAFGYEPAAMSPDLHKFYLLFTAETASDQQMRRIWIERKNIQLAKRGIPSYNALDYLPKARAVYQRDVLGKK